MSAAAAWLHSLLSEGTPPNSPPSASSITKDRADESEFGKEWGGVRTGGLWSPCNGSADTEKPQEQQAATKGNNMQQQQQQYQQSEYGNHASDMNVDDIPAEWRPYVAPNGSAFCSKKVRLGVLPQMLKEILGEFLYVCMHVCLYILFCVQYFSSL